MQMMDVTKIADKNSVTEKLKYTTIQMNAGRISAEMVHFEFMSIRSSSTLFP